MVVRVQKDEETEEGQPVGSLKNCKLQRLPGKKAANLEMDIESGIQMTHFTFFPPITFHGNSSATIMVINFYYGTVVKTNVKNQLMFCFHF